MNTKNKSIGNHFYNLTKNPLFYTFMNSLHDAFMITDHEAIVKYVNDSYTRITGVPAEQIIGKKLTDVRPGARLPEVLSTGIALHGIKRKERNIEYIADIDPVFSKNKLIGAIAILRDITELQELSAKLRAYSSKVEKFRNSVRGIHRASYTLDNIIGQSSGMQAVKNIVKRISTSSSSVLIQGESGTGKELFAHAIHNLSPRNHNPFVAINCAAFPPNLLLSEIFGYEEGAFTGASKGGKLGLFEIADRGSLFLDEVGDMDFELQAKILRVLETGEFLRIGGTTPVKVDVRIISATNQNLDELVWQKRFREDLLYRLNVVNLQIPPLRERTGEIPLLVEHFKKEIGKKTGKKISLSNEALDILCDHSFPGNVRELVNILEFSSNLSDSNQILPPHLPIAIRVNSKSIEKNLEGAVKNAEREAIIRCLTQFGMNLDAKKRAAAELGISLSSLYNKIKQYDIRKKVNVSE